MKSKMWEFRLNLWIMVFMVSSLIGWVYETVLTSLRWGYFADRGFLNLPICPIYGFGAMFLLLLFGRMKNSLLIFVTGTCATTIVELAASYLLEYLFHMELWTYRHWPLNFQGRISFWSSVLFGLLGVILMKVVYPGMKVLVGKVSMRMRCVISVIMINVFVMDIIFCLMQI